MGRRVEDKPAAAASEINEEALRQDMVASGQVIEADLAREEQARHMARQLGYDEGLSVPELKALARGHMRRTVEETLELGRVVLLLKIKLPHGEFGPCLRELNFNPRIANKFMQAAAKFYGSGQKLAQLPGMSQSKLLELVMLDDDDASLLAETGAIPGLPTDAIECMSVSELKAAIRERDERIAAKEKVAEQTQKTIQRLQEDIAGRPAPSPEFAAEQSLRDLDAEALGCAARIVSSLRAAMLAANDADVAPALVAQALAAAVGRVLAAARAVAEDFCIATTGADASPEARDEAAEIDAVWAAVNAELAEKAAANVSKN